MRQCLIITATIDPNSVLVTHNDVKQRRDEYLKALNYYLAHYDGTVFFIENSSYKIDEDLMFQEILKHTRLRVIKYPLSQEFAKGKGYQEFEMIDQTVKMIASDYDEFIKLTGRYLVTNFDQLKKQKCKGVVMDRHLKTKVAITSFYKCNINFYLKYLSNGFKEADDSNGVFIEHIIYQKLNKISNKQVSIFNSNPIFKGVSGSYGGSLNRHPLKMKARNVERKLMRILGLKEFKIEY
jgi:hypothetical protein